MPRVLNKHKDKIPPDAVYIGRPSKWGNPFSHLNGARSKFRVATREEAVKKHKEWLPPRLIEAAKAELKGKDLVCFCKPLACHGDYLLEIANETHREH